MVFGALRELRRGRRPEEKTTTKAPFGFGQERKKQKED